MQTKFKILSTSYIFPNCFSSSQKISGLLVICIQIKELIWKSLWALPGSVRGRVVIFTWHLFWIAITVTYSLGKYLEYLITYILKENTEFLQQKSKQTCLPLSMVFSPQHSFLPLVLISTWKEVSSFANTTGNRVRNRLCGLPNSITCTSNSSSEIICASTQCFSSDQKGLLKPPSYLHFMCFGQGCAMVSGNTNLISFKLNWTRVSSPKASKHLANELT